MSGSLDMQVNGASVSSEFRLISSDDNKETIMPGSKTYAREISILDKGLLSLIGIISTLALYFAITHDLKKTKHNSYITNHPAVASLLEDKLAKYQILGKTEIWFKDIERITENNYFVRGNDGGYLYEFDVEGKRLIVYPVRKNKIKKPF